MVSLIRGFLAIAEKADLCVEKVLAIGQLCSLSVGLISLDLATYSYDFWTDAGLCQLV